MTTEQRIEAIKEAIEKADRFQSNLSGDAINVPFLGSLKIRALLNNLGSISRNYLEVGSHVGGSFSSTIYGNPLSMAIAVDSWESDENSLDKAYPKFLENSNRFKHLLTSRQVVKSDCFSLDFKMHPWNIVEHLGYVDFYNYDAGHSFEDQKRALTYYKPILADEFIFVCDDWQYGDVKSGTLAGIKEGGYDVLFDRELLNPEPYTEDQHLNDHWWRGYYVALLKKK